MGSLSEEVRTEVLCGHICDLEAENAKLREELEAAKHDLSLFSGELVASKSENVKLRMLVQYIYDECYGDDWFAEQAEALGFEPNF